MFLNLFADSSLVFITYEGNLDILDFETNKQKTLVKRNVFVSNKLSLQRFNSMIPA